MPAADFLAYADTLSVVPGETIAFKVSTAHPRYQAQVARFASGPYPPREAGTAGPPLMRGEYEGREQPIPIGSYILVSGSAALPATDALTIQLWLSATLPERGHDQGIVGGGAAGDEIDRYDLSLGTPPETLRLATSEGEHSDAYQLVIEDTESSQAHWGGAACSRVRADMVYLETTGGGAVFATGSINWIASLPHNGFANNVVRITENVLRRFSGLG